MSTTQALKHLAPLRIVDNPFCRLMYSLEMSISIAHSDDPAQVLSSAGEFLVSQPILHNLILSILDARVSQREPGRYWLATERGKTVGVALQSPLTFAATLTPMASRVVAAMVDAIADANIALPGVNGDAATAASFAGQWTERCKSAATPFQGNRIYELIAVKAPPQVRGKARQARLQDRGLMIQWSRAFSEEIEEDPRGTERRVDGELADGRIWLWEHDGEPMSMAAGRKPVERVVRVAGVYTPPDKRKRGYAEACVHGLSKHVCEAGNRCMLYTDLANPTSNSIYRRIGYKVVGEALRYRFE